MGTASEQRWVTAVEIVTRLRQAGHQAFFAGGCVRDWLMGIPPKDIDIATSADPQTVRSLFSHSLPVGQSFGVIIVVVNGEHFEVATFRTESNYADGRRPVSVQFADARLDVQRRDFTINGLLFDPLTNEVIDYVGGREDMIRRTLRSIGSPFARFAEDHLRMLRAVRFATRFALTIDPDTFKAIQENAASIHRVSAERIREELDGIFTGRSPDLGLSLLDASGLLAQVLPEVCRMKGVPQPPQCHPEGDVFHHTLKSLSLMRQPSSVLAFAVLLHDAGKSETASAAVPFDGHPTAGAKIAQEVSRRLRFSTAESEQVAALVANHHVFQSLVQLKLSEMKRLLRQNYFPDLLELHRIDALASHGDLSSWEFSKRKLEQFPYESLRPARLITGNDLILLGLKPGPLFRQILESVEEAQLDERLESREQAIAFVRARWCPAAMPETEDQ